MRPTPFLRLWHRGLHNRPLSPPVFRSGSPRCPLQVRRQGSLGRKPDKTELPAQESGTSIGDPTATKPLFEELALLTPAIIPKDPMGTVRTSDSAAALLDHSALVVERQIELLNVFLVSTPSLTLRTGIRTMQSICHYGPPGQPCRVQTCSLYELMSGI
jgi:hypothetical protein